MINTWTKSKIQPQKWLSRTSGFLAAFCLVFSFTSLQAQIVATGPASAVNQIDNANPPFLSPATVVSNCVVEDDGDANTVGYDISAVNLDITHTFDADLELTLIAPNGVTLDLSSNNGGGDDDFTGTVFQDGGIIIDGIGTGDPNGAPFTNIYEPEGGTFAATFAGAPVGGDWTLQVLDDAGGDEGTLNSYSIEFTPSNDACADAHPTVPSLAGTVYSGCSTGAAFSPPPACDGFTLPNTYFSVIGNGGDLTLTAASNAIPVISVIEGGCGGVCLPDNIFNDNPSFTGTFVIPASLVGVEYIIALDDNGFPGDYTLTVQGVPPCTVNAICQDPTVLLDATGNGTITAAELDGGSNSDCVGPLAFSIGDADADGTLDRTAFTCADANAQFPVTLVVTDTDSGATDECVATVTVLDQVAPMVTCVNTTVALGADGTVSIEAADVTATTLTITGGDNGSGAAGTTSATVTITVPGSIDVDWFYSTTDIPGFDDFGFTLNGVTTLLADTNGQTGTETIAVVEGDVLTFFVDTDDNIFGAGVITIVPTTITSDYDPANFVIADDSGGTVTFAPVAFDACGIASFAIDNDDFDCTELGANTVTLTATDVNGNVGTCTAVVTVIDNTDPTAVCIDATVLLDIAGNGTIAGADIDGGSTTTCGDPLTLTIDPLDQAAFTCADANAQFPNTTLIVTNTVTGETATCESTVTVLDQVAPMVACMPFTAELDANGLVEIDIEDVLAPALTIVGGNSAGGNLGPAGTTEATVTINNAGSLVLDFSYTTPDADGFDDFGFTLNGTTTLLADANGQNGTLTIDVLPGDVLTFFVATDDNGFGAGTVALTPDNFLLAGDLGQQNWTVVNTVGSDGSVTFNPTDACGIASLSLDDDDFTCAELGVGNTVTVTATDVNGNVGTCTAVVTVEDNLAPVMVCNDDTVELDATGNVVLDANALAAGSTDNCDPNPVFVAAPAALTCANAGTTVAVTVTGTDASNNAANCIAMITVEDNTAPVANCVNVNVILDENGEGSTTGIAIAGGSSDACGIASIEPAALDFTCANIGANTVTITVTDVNGNEATCMSTVTVSDNIDPNVICRPDINTQTNSGECDVNLILLKPFASDNCSIASITVSGNNGANITNGEPTTGTFQPGLTTLTWSVTDAGGNTVTCQNEVVVYEYEAPFIDPSYAQITTCTDDGLCSAKVNINPNITDNCGMVNITGTGIFVLPAGVHQREVTATDVNGNVTTVIIPVYVHDCEAPEITCAQGPIVVNSSNNNPTPVNIPNASATDNCGVTGITNDALDAFALGEHTVTYTATDAYGNESTCTVDVVVNPGVWASMAPIQASIPSIDEESFVNWNAPQVGINCEQCGETDIPDFVYLGDFFGHQYFMHTSTGSFYDAQDAAIQMGGHLVSVNNAEENFFLAGVMPSDVENVWIGFSDELGEEDGDYSWVNEDEITYVNFGSENIPSNEDQNFTLIDQEGDWVLTDDTEAHFFIVERPCVDIVQTGPIVEVENNAGEVEEVLLEAGDMWPEGEYNVTYQATDLCGNFGVFGFDVSVIEPDAEYCQSGSNDNEGLWIERVEIGNMNQESEADEDGYGDYLDQTFQLANMAEEDETPSTTISLEAGGNEDGQTLYWNVFVDLNQDGDFFDNGEMLYQAASQNAIEATLVLPEAVAFDTRMRVMVSRFGYSQACGNIYTGEVEDYAVSIDNLEFTPGDATDAFVANVYPNPTVDYVMVHLTANEVPATISIFDQLGKLHHQQAISEHDGQTFRIDLSGFAAGMYQLQVATETGAETHTITVMARP